jgi:hypothetical protein
MHISYQVSNESTCICHYKIIISKKTKRDYAEPQRSKTIIFNAEWIHEIVVIYGAVPLGCFNSLENYISLKILLQRKKEVQRSSCNL